MKSWKFSKLNKSWLSHPLFILLLGAAITSLLFPYLSSIWQVNERELDVKFDLAKEVGDNVNSYLMKPLQISSIVDWNSSKSIRDLTPSMTEGLIQGMESCSSTRQRLVLYLSENDILPYKWDNICTALAFYYSYSLIPREPDIGSNLTSGLSRTFIELASKRLGLSLNEGQLENLSTETKSTEYMEDVQKIRGTIINETQYLMNRIIRSDLVGY